MSEDKVLFELRITEDEDGLHVEVNESPEWQAYHAARHSEGEGCLTAVMDALHHVHDEISRHQETRLRHTLDMLQGLYDDLYSSRANAES
jgi:hypothetical protein